MTKDKIGVVILAAGKGTRLGCVDRPKVMMEIGGKPILSYIIKTLQKAGFAKNQIAVVVGFQEQKVREYLGDDVVYVHQEQQLGTAHAAWTGMQSLPKDLELILIMNGDDSAFYTVEILEDFMQKYSDNDAILSVLTAEVDDNTQLGRVIRDSDGNFIKALEKEELNAEQKKIKEINTGTYLMNRKWFEEIFPRMEKINGLGEYGMPTIVKMAVQDKKKVTAIPIPDNNQWFGINNKEELEKANTRKYANQ
jgi:bifunctional UDP-N-acetylglucosamine pyrophosphorylase / glucosamine-1-phosphate N-acetyltransferase